ncbi:hypothetical protein [Haloarcula nitratireducens]|uniref:DUF7967 domain-containing protein n=1 Tax=Haloarcula nitratireducens TaxID=2487749 RepID=A0AAW4PG44_9EURY|nr:hypothetical protein [Halomicroarcula nitratireducens]MBX0296623.1 hypothetical protein [Halomicroarcula nitratireducens]
MTDETDDVRVWLVDRGYNNRDLIVLKYATPDGTRFFRRELAAQAMDLDSVTAAKNVSASDLENVDDSELRERYESEAKRMSAQHDPDDTI